MIAALLLATAATSCALTQDDLATNTKLTFAKFDQQLDVPSSARSLASRGCYAAAVQAYRHYLLFGPVGSDFERNVMRFHMGQYLADDGREQEAATIIAATRREIDPTRPTFDWNTYVIGTYAFLIKDRPLLDQMVATLSRSNQFGNRMNAWVLRRFQRCPNQPYRVAYGIDPRCSAADDPAPKD